MRLTLTSREDTYNFRRGTAVRITIDGRPLTRWERLRFRVSWFWWRATERFRARLVVSEIDSDEGAVTVTTERWSWLRWRWERRTP